MAITHLGLSGWCPKTLCCSQQPGSLAKPGTRRLADRPPPPQSPVHIVRTKTNNLDFFKTHLGELKPRNCVAHLTVDSVHTKVAISRIRLSMLKMAHSNLSLHHWLSYREEQPWTYEESLQLISLILIFHLNCEEFTLVRTYPSRGPKIPPVDGRPDQTWQGEKEQPLIKRYNIVQEW